VAGLALRFAAWGPLWLDEALSVNIARLPLSELGDALRHDGSPPLYYVLLHGWVSVFGHGAVAARAMSGVVAVATVPAVWAFARSLADRRTAAVAALLAATSPFAVRYGTEARMYALAQLLCALGGWALVSYLRRPRRGSFVAVAVCSGLLALTHYWALFLLAAVFLLLAWRRRWGAAGAVAAGGVLFLPWLPAFAYQLAHTGTPWAPRPQPSVLVDAVFEWAGVGAASRFLGVLLILLAALALFGRAVEGARVELDVARPHPVPGRIAAVVFGTLALGTVAGIVLGSGYAARYSSVVLVPFTVLTAMGTQVFASPVVRRNVVGGVAVLGVVAAVPGVLTPRTQAGAVADALRERAVAGDVVVYCPDQLGPAVSRLVQPGLEQVVFPTRGRPDLVDWVDYGPRNKAADGEEFGRALVRDYAGRTIWLVVAGGYRTFGDRCDILAETLRAERPSNEPVVRSRGRYRPERMSLQRFAP
jgi:hypothetical protein